MMFLFVMMILAGFFGGALLWLSGLTVGLRSGSDSPGDKDLVKLQQDRDKLAAEASAETARVVEEMERVENELTMAAEEMKSLKDENEALKARGTSHESKSSPPTPPPLPPTPPPLPVKAPTPEIDDSEELDSAQAQLDLERVAHRRTLDELAAIKNLLSVKIAERSDPSGGAGPQRDRKSAGFKTMSIDNRSQSVSGTDHDRLRQSYNQTIREKDRLETELARTQQELQLLKIRQK